MTARPRLYFMLVKLPDGNPATLTIVRESHRFIAQLRSFDFEDRVNSSYTTDKLDGMDTERFLEEVESLIARGPGKTYTCSIPPGTTRTAWLAATEQRASDDRFCLLPSKDGCGFSYAIRSDAMKRPRILH